MLRASGQRQGAPPSPDYPPRSPQLRPERGHGGPSSSFDGDGEAGELARGPSWESDQGWAPHSKFAKSLRSIFKKTSDNYSPGSAG